MHKSSRLFLPPSSLAAALLIMLSSVAGLPTLASPTPSYEASVSVLQCVRDSNSLLVPVEINGRTCLMLFDTGADNITLSRKQMTDLGLNAPSGQTTGSIQGVGAVTVSTWKCAATVKVGRLIRKDFPLNVEEQNHMYPIIGRNFFQSYSIKVDPASARITLTPPGFPHRLQSKNLRSVPLDRLGNQLLIPVAVNGLPMRMLFDTGADGITFNQQQAESINLHIPPDAKRELHMGVAGLVEGLGFTVKEIRLGPIVKSNVKVSVIKSPGMPYPLLGSDYFRDCSYTIDDEHSQLAFERI